MKILITGATSYIAKYISKQFLEEGHSIYGLSRKNPEIIHQNYKWIKKDLLKDNLDYIEIDFIIHLAAESKLNMPATVYYESNIKLTKIVSTYAKLLQPKAIFYTSSMKVYGEIKEKEVDEETSFINQDLYGASKYFGEKLLEEVSPTISLRLPGIIALGSHGWIDSVYQKLKKNEDISLTNSKYNHVLHAFDIFNVIKMIIKKGSFTKTNIFNLSSSNSIDSKEAVLFLKQSLNSTSDIKILDVNSFNYILSNKKISKIYKPMDVIDSLELYLKEMKLGKYE